MSMRFITPRSLNSRLIQFKLIENFVRKLVQKFLLSCTPVTLNQGQDQLVKYQNVEYISLYHHTTFKSNPFINIVYMPILKFFI